MVDELHAGGWLMAICYAAQTIYAFATASTTTKTAYSTLVSNAAVQPENCPGVVALSKTEYADFLANITNFGWDSAAFEVAVEGTLLSFAAGVGVGLLISVVKRFRSP